MTRQLAKVHTLAWKSLILSWLPGGRGIFRFPCAHCRNLSVGPLGIELVRKPKQQDGPAYHQYSPPEWFGVWR